MLSFFTIQHQKLRENVHLMNTESQRHSVEQRTGFLLNVTKTFKETQECIKGSFILTSVLKIFIYCFRLIYS